MSHLIIQGTIGVDGSGHIIHLQYYWYHTTLKTVMAMLLSPPLLTINKNAVISLYAHIRNPRVQLTLAFRG